MQEAAPEERPLVAPSRDEEQAERDARRGQRAIYHSYYALAFLVGTFVGLKHVAPETTVANADATTMDAPPLAAAPAAGDGDALASAPWAANGSLEANGSWASSFLAEAAAADRSAANDSTAQSPRSAPNASRTVVAGDDRGGLGSGDESQT